MLLGRFDDRTSVLSFATIRAGGVPPHNSAKQRSGGAGAGGRRLGVCLPAAALGKGDDACDVLERCAGTER